MAGRIRTLKPEILEDAATAGLSANAHRLFIGILSLADDHGNARAAPSFLRGQVFHSAPDAPTDLEPLLAELGRKLVTFYAVDGEMYVHLRGWAKHQRITNAGEPRVPLPPGWRLETYDRQEGNRTRRYARSIPPATVALGGAAPTTSLVESGAAPPTTNYLPPTNGTAGSRSPISDHDHDHEGDRGAATPPAPPTAPPEVPDLTDTERQAAIALDEAADLWPSQPLPAIADAVQRLVRVVENDPHARRDGLDPVTVAGDVAAKVRTWALKHPVATEVQRLGQIGEIVRWILDDCRRGRRRPDPRLPRLPPDRGGARP